MTFLLFFYREKYRTAIVPMAFPHAFHFALCLLYDGCTGIKESDTGLAVPSQWDLVSDKQMMQEEQPLQVRKSYRPYYILLTVFFIRS